MKKILITGGAGFIGYFLVGRLSRDSASDITIVDNLSRGKIDKDFEKLLVKENVKFVEGDVTDKAVFTRLQRDYEYIYHLSAVIGVRNVTQNPDRVLSVNAFSSMNVFEYARGLNNLKKIFFSSTSEVYAGTMKHFSINIPTDESVPLTVEDIFSYRSTYALSKIFGESTAFVYGRKYGIPVTIGRYHNVYGPRMGFSHVIPETFMKIRKSNVIDVPSPDHTRAFCFVDDAVEFTVMACENRDATDQILHIGNPEEEIKMSDLVMKIAAIMGKDVAINRLPDAPGSVARRCPDISKVKRLTGFSPRISLDEGLGKTYEWYKDKLCIKVG